MIMSNIVYFKDQYINSCIIHKEKKRRKKKIQKISDVYKKARATVHAPSLQVQFQVPLATQARDTVYMQISYKRKVPMNLARA